MASITQITNFKKDIESISLNIFKIQSSINVIELLNSIADEIITQLSDPELLYIMSKTSDYLNKFNELLSKVNKPHHKALYEQKLLSSKDESYVFFQVDEKPITGAQLKKEHEQQISIYDFDEIKKQYEQEHQKPLTPVKRKSKLDYMGEYFYCGTPNDYLYNNNKVDQCLCKACNNTFSYKTKFYEELSLYCHHCRNKLQVKHD